MCTVELMNNLSFYSNHLLAAHLHYICRHLYKKIRPQCLSLNSSVINPHSSVQYRCNLRSWSCLLRIGYRQMKCHVFRVVRQIFLLYWLTVMLKEMAILHCIWLRERSQRNWDIVNPIHTTTTTLEGASWSLNKHSNRNTESDKLPKWTAASMR